MILAPVLALVLAAAPADRLAIGTEWRCASAFADGATAEFTVAPYQPGKPDKALTFTKSSTPDIPPARISYGAGHADKNDLFDRRKAARDPDYPYFEFTEGFEAEGLSITAGWWSKTAEVSLQIHSYDHKNRRDPDLRNEKISVLTCRRMGEK